MVSSVHAQSMLHCKQAVKNLNQTNYSKIQFVSLIIHVESETPGFSIENIEMDLPQVEYDSDDEVFFGKLTLKEVKKHILRDVYYKKLSQPMRSRRALNDTDCKIIETSSEPNIPRNVTESPAAKFTSSSDCHLMSSLKSNVVVTDLQNEDSFLQIEENLSKHNNLDNTLDAIDFILNNAPSYIKEKEQPVNIVMKECVDDGNNKDKIISQSTSKEDGLEKSAYKNQISTSLLPTPAKNIKHDTARFINTPRFNKKETPTVFRTPKLPLSHRKDNNLMKTPVRSKGFEHIASPIAAYIKNSPQVPLVKDVHPKKPLPSVSAIPKLKREGSQIKISNKENVVLPPLAYRSAKKTTVMNMNKDNWPQSNWPKKLTSSLKKPVVLKHDHRETTKKPLVSPLDSFADLSLHQADVSICTQKIAFNQP